MTADTLIQVDISTFIMVLFGTVNVVIIGPLAWIVRSAISEQKEMKKEHDSFREYAHREFVRKVDYVHDMTEIKALLNRIFDKLDDKEDRHDAR